MTNTALCDIDTESHSPLGSPLKKRGDSTRTTMNQNDIVVSNELKTYFSNLCARFHSSLGK
jgi:hypothetical protein